MSAPGCLRRFPRDCIGVLKERSRDNGWFIFMKLDLQVSGMNGRFEIYCGFVRIVERVQADGNTPPA